MNKDLAEVQDIFLAKINRLCNNFGLNNIMAQLYSLLYFCNGPLCLNDMCQRLKISKGSVSINIRALERYGAVRRVWIKGSRKDYYEAETDIVAVIADRINSMMAKRLSEFADMLEVSYRALDSVNTLDKTTQESVKIFRDRLDLLRNIHSKGNSLFNIFNSGILPGILDNARQAGAGSVIPDNSAGAILSSKSAIPTI